MLYIFIVGHIVACVIGLFGSVADILSHFSAKKENVPALLCKDALTYIICMCVVIFASSYMGT